MNTFLERHASKIAGVLHCWDRVIINGTIPDIGYPDAMASFLRTREIRLFDYTKWAEPLRDRIRENAERLAKDNGLKIEFIRKADSFRKDDRIAELLKTRGMHPGLVHIFSAMENCPAYQPWHDKESGKTFMRHDSAKCLHYYFYFLDPDLGLCFLRVPTWAPYRLQFYFNGHNALACALRKQGIAFTQQDNSFTELADFTQAQELVEQFDIKALHAKLNDSAQRFCPIIQIFRSGYHWSLTQVEFSTDVLFVSREVLAPLYENLTRTAIHAVKPEHVATFLGRRLSPLYDGPLDSSFHTRIEGTCIRHFMANNSLKLYDKCARICRIECTSSDVTFFKHHRYVVQKDGTKVFKLAPLKKSIYSLSDLRELMLAANLRYLEFLAAVDDPGPHLRNVEKIAAPVQEKERSYKGFNLFAGPDLDLFRTLLRGEFNISGFQAKDLRRHLPDLTPNRLSRILKRLRLHGLIKKIGQRYKYYLTSLGQITSTAALKLRELLLIPSLAPPTP